MLSPPSSLHCTPPFKFSGEKPCHWHPSSKRCLTVRRSNARVRPIKCRLGERRTLWSQQNIVVASLFILQATKAGCGGLVTNLNVSYVHYSACVNNLWSSIGVTWVHTLRPLYVISGLVTSLLVCDITSVTDQHHSTTNSVGLACEHD